MLTIIFRKSLNRYLCGLIPTKRMHKKKPSNSYPFSFFFQFNRTRDFVVVVFQAVIVILRFNDFTDRKTCNAKEDEVQLDIYYYPEIKTTKRIQHNSVDLFRSADVVKFRATEENRVQVNRALAIN